MQRTRLRGLFRRVWPRKAARWRRSALRRTGNQADADDVVQEAIVRTLRADPDLQDTNQTDSYVMKAIRDVANDRHRARGVRRRLRRALNLASDEEPSLLEEAVSVEEAHYRALAKAHVLRELDRLEPELRETIELSYFRQPPLKLLKLREIAEIQAVSVATVRRHRRKALEILGEAVNWQPK